MELKKLYQRFLSFLSSFSVSRSFLVLGLINFVSLTLLLFVSPVLGIYWLLLVTLFFLFKGNYKNIFIAWGVFFITWYFFFIVCFLDFESQILIGGEHTSKIMMYISDKYSNPLCPWYTKLFKGFCLQTVLLLQLLSVKLGFSIYIPSLIKILMFFLKFIFGGDKGPATCAGEENSKKEEASTDEYSSIFSSVFKGGAASKVKVKDDLDACASVREMLRANKGFSLKKYLWSDHGSIHGDKYVYYAEGYFPGFGRFTTCNSREATKEDILKDINKKG